MRASLVSAVIALASIVPPDDDVGKERTPARATVETITARVASYEGSWLVLELESGVVRRFVTSDTTLMPQDPPMIGDRVSVKYRRGSNPAEVLELTFLGRSAIESSLDSEDHPEATAFPDSDSGAF